MNKLAFILVSLLIIVSGANGFFYWQQNQDLEEALDEVSTLNGRVASLQSNVSSYNNEISNIGDSISSFGDDISGLMKRVTTIGTTNYDIPSIISLLEPSIVRIEVDIPRNRTPGTGIMLTESGYVMTNSHVIEGSTRIQVTLAGGQSYTATVIGDDPDMDLAILEITSNRNDFAAATLGNYKDIAVGEDILAMGFPYSDELGDEISTTTGIVSAVRFVELYGYEYVQTDAEISMGFGGGPLVNMRGEVIGITTWRYTGSGGEGLNFAIPVNNMKDFVEDIIGVFG